MSKWARKRDAVEKSIILALRASGCSVMQLDGAGQPDLVVGYRDVDGVMPDRVALLEVKDLRPGASKAMKRSDAGPLSELTPAQRRFWSGWTGPRIHIVHTPDEAMDCVFPERVERRRTA